METDSVASNRPPLELRALIHGVTALAWSALPDGSPEFVNQPFTKYSGLSPDQVCARSKRSLHRDDAGRFEKWWGIRVTPRLWVLIAASVWFLTAPDVMAQSVRPESLQWSVPTTMPLSALVAVASGDPTGPGETTFLISMPNGYRIPPHFHPGTVYVKVREGTLLVGMGDELDAEQAQALVAGDSVSVPAGMHHFWIARGRTVVSMRFTGPFTITYLRAEDAPRPRAFPFGY